MQTVDVLNASNVAEKSAKVVSKNRILHLQYSAAAQTRQFTAIRLFYKCTEIGNFEN